MTDYTPKPPEWWTSENTEAWMREQWGEPSERSEAMGTWARPYTYGDRVPRAGAACYAVIPPKVLAEWRANDPRPSNATYYDGTPVVYKPLTVKKRTRKAIAA